MKQEVLATSPRKGAGRVRAGIFFLMGMLWLLLQGLPLSGATITVSTTQDHLPGSLRDALNQACQNNEDDTIHIPAGLYVLNGEPDEDHNFGGDLDIQTSGKITLIGAGTSLTIIDGNLSDRVFHILSGTISLNELTVQNGYPRTKGYDCAGTTEKDYLPQHGGGIYNAGTLTLNHCNITSNHSKNGGWLCRDGFSYGTDGSHGGGIFNSGVLVINQSHIIQNTAGASGYNGMYSEDAGNGGGIYNTGTLTLSHSNLGFNKTESKGHGAGIYSTGTITLSNSMIYGNTTAPGGGCRHCDYGTSSGSGAGILNAKGKATISNCTIFDNKTGRAGIGDLDIGHSGNGAGVYNSGQMTLTQSALYNNATGEGNANFFNIVNKIGGGGIYNESTGQLTLINCTVSGNSTGNGVIGMDDLSVGGYGAGILNDRGSVSLTNCTVANNYTGGPTREGTHGGPGGGIYNETGGQCTLTNTLLADNTVSPNQKGPDGFGTLTSNGYNLIENTADITLTGNTTSNITGKDPMLLPLVNNGGNSYTHALPINSPAVDKGYSPTYKTDQRGVTRPQDITSVSNARDGSDIGAYELDTPYYISGRVRVGNTGLEGVQLEFTSGGGENISTCMTNRSGYYYHPVPAGWSGDVTPHLKNYTFTPQYKGFLPVYSALSGQDFTAQPYRARVTITSPQANAVVGGVVLISAVLISAPDTSPDTTTETVTFLVDGSTIAEDSSAPYECRWNTTSLTETSHTIIVRAKNSAGQTHEAQISVFVSNQNRIVLSREQVVMNYYLGGESAPPQTITISNGGTGKMEWSLNSDADWLHCSDHSGVNAHPIYLYQDMNRSYTPGTYTANITITAPNTINSPLVVPVRLNVFSGASQNPFGLFETPDTLAPVSSSVPMTGWALDDIGIVSVKIYRAPLAGEGEARIYVGQANLVQGARPDIPNTYPDFPNNDRAGWGYMLLTNFLPYGGNGTFTFYAVAEDQEGNETTLGSKTLICDNVNAIKPFGALDTPAQGELVLGRTGDYTNFGWALTPRPNGIPVDGSTITVWVDGVALGHPQYNKYRQDIATLFPDYANSQGAVGYFTLNASALADGVHTIAWSVTDDAGNTDGIGSRYFTIYSGSDQPASSPSSSPTRAQIAALPTAIPEPIQWTRGFTLPNATTATQDHTSHKKEANPLLRETEPLTLHFSKNFVPSRGYLLLGDRLTPLPIGSTLNIKTRSFHWLPGPGFIGDYELLFMGTDGTGESCKKQVHITILPKYN